MKKVYRILKSTKTAAVLAGLMLPFLILGTLIPQNESPEAYRALFGDPGARILQTLRITDIYHSPWFLAVVALFFLNLMVGNLDAFVTLVRALPKTGFRGNVWLKAVTRFFHLVFLVMLAGFILTAATKIDGAVLLRNGESTNLRGLPELRLKLNRFWIDYLNFQGQTYTKDYFSDLELYDGDQLVRHQVIEVNAPLRYKDIWIYQAFYRQYAKVAVVKVTDTLGIQEVQIGSPVVLPGLSTMILLDEYQMGKLYFFREPRRVENLQPLIPVYVAHGQWEFVGGLAPGRPVDVDGLKIVLLDASQASGFTYRKDAGVPFVFVGAILAGLLMFVVVIVRASQEL